MDYKISVILPVYNVEKYLQRSFESLKCQTIGFDNLQVIFADDCSTDQSWNIIQEYAGTYPNVESLRLSKNSGACGAPLNAGMELVEADYFMFLDPDDAFTDNACELLYDAIERKKVDFALGYQKTIDPEGHVLEEKTGDYNGLEERVYSMPNDLPPFVGCGVTFKSIIYKTSLYRKHSIIFPAGIPGQDHMFKIHYIFISKNAYYIDDCVYSYTVRPDSISRSGSMKHIIGQNTAFLLCYDLFKKYNHAALFGSFARDALAYIIRMLLEASLQDSEVEEIFKSISWMFEYCKTEGLSCGSEYAEIMGAVFSSDIRLDVYKSLKKLRKWELELYNAREYLLGQIEGKNKAIAELEEAKTWFLGQIENREKKLDTMRQEISIRGDVIKAKSDEIKAKSDEIKAKSDEIKAKDKLLSGRLVRTALRLCRAKDRFGRLLGRAKGVCTNR